MKNNKVLKIFIVLLLLITLTGCTKLLKDSDNKVVRNEETGQNVTENIICKPTDKNLIKIYNDNKIDIEKLPNCKDLKFGGKYENLWNNLFVRPLAFIIVKLGKIVKSYGLSIILVTLAIRLILFPVTKKTLLQSQNMKKAKPELDRLEKKYEGKTDNESVAKKGQEMMMIYKKYNISPLSGCLFAFIQIPLIMGFYEAINRVPAIFESNFLGLKMGMTPRTAIAGGSWHYIILCIILIIVTYASYKLNPSMSAGDTANPMGNPKTMGIFMTGFIGLLSFSLPTAIAVYWIISSLFTIIQNFMLKGGEKA